MQKISINKELTWNDETIINLISNFNEPMLSHKFIDEFCKVDKIQPQIFISHLLFWIDYFNNDLDSINNSDYSNYTKDIFLEMVFYLYNGEKRMHKLIKNFYICLAYPDVYSFILDELMENNSIELLNNYEKIYKNIMTEEDFNSFFWRSTIDNFKLKYELICSRL